MAQKKLQRFEDLKTLQNVLQYPLNMAGNWKTFFNNKNPITLELACGKGEYAIGLAELYLQKNLIGIDIKGNRIWVGAKKALKFGFSNVAFLRIQIDKITEYFSAQEIEDIWITFPDPQLRTGKAKKRLTHPRFLRLYKQVLHSKGCIHLKTDSTVLYKFTKLVIERYHCFLLEDIANVNNEKIVQEELKIKTYYESLDIAKSNQIYYLKFSLPEFFPDISADKLLQQFLKEYEHVD